MLRFCRRIIQRSADTQGHYRPYRSGEPSRQSTGIQRSAAPNTVRLLLNGSRERLYVNVTEAFLTAAVRVRFFKSAPRHVSHNFVRKYGLGSYADIVVICLDLTKVITIIGILHEVAPRIVYAIDRARKHDRAILPLVTRRGRCRGGPKPLPEGAAWSAHSRYVGISVRLQGYIA